MNANEPVWVHEVKSSTFDLADLPDNIEQQINDYLKIEFASESNTELSFVGDYSLWEKPIKCWYFGHSSMCATVQPYLDNFYIAITEKALFTENINDKNKYSESPPIRDSTTQR